MPAGVCSSSGRFSAVSTVTPDTCDPLQPRCRPVSLLRMWEQLCGAGGTVQPPQGLIWIIFGDLQSPAVVCRDEMGAQFACWW